MIVSYPFVLCKVKGCVRLSEDIYPLCNNKEKRLAGVAPVLPSRPSKPQREQPHDI